MSYALNPSAEWDPVDGVHVELVDDMLNLYMTKSGLSTFMAVPSSEDAIEQLDRGLTPIGWEDGNGNTVCYDNGIPVDPVCGDPCYWIVCYDIGHSDGTVESSVDFHPFEAEALYRASDDWERLSVGDKTSSRIRVAEIGPDYPITEKVLRIGWDSSVPGDSMGLREVE